MEILKAVDPGRKTLPNDLDLSSWSTLEPYYTKLKNAELTDAKALENWLQERSEMEGAIAEELARRYIRMTTDTNNEEHRKAYSEYVSEVIPKVQPEEDLLNRKLIEAPALEKLESDKYFVMLRATKSSVQLFRQENIPIEAKLKELESDYTAIVGAMLIEHEGEDLTLQQASLLLKQTDRKLRKEIYVKIGERRLKDQQRLDELLSEMIKLRHQIAKNAGFENYRDYKFEELGRYDYNLEDCRSFHQSIEELIMPLVDAIMKERKVLMKLHKLRPWDLSVDPLDRKALKPFENTEELLKGSIDIFEKLDDDFASCLREMQAIGHFDLASRKGKAPGGYNYPMPETGLPFIFMNATSALRDLVTMMHEGGHAIHNYLTKDFELNAFKSTPSEIAEVASMSMELISMDHWDRFFENSEELKRAKKEHMQSIITTLPWIALIDAFQHWLYENPKHSIEERHRYWRKISQRFFSQEIDRTGIEAYAQTAWQGQLHIFEVPFYYIEYGIAQLAAISIWKQYKENMQSGLASYRAFLEMGYTRPMPEVFEKGGVKFDFSSAYLANLMSFLKNELKNVND